MKNRNAEIEKAVYQKYIVPTQRPAKDYVGAEFELPIVNLKKQAPGFAKLAAVAETWCVSALFGKAPIGIQEVMG